MAASKAKRQKEPRKEQPQYTHARTHARTHTRTHTTHDTERETLSERASARKGKDVDPRGNGQGNALLKVSTGRLAPLTLHQQPHQQPTHTHNPLHVVVQLLVR